MDPNPIEKTEAKRAGRRAQSIDVNPQNFGQILNLTKSLEKKVSFMHFTPFFSIWESNECHIFTLFIDGEISIWVRSLE